MSEKKMNILIIMSDEQRKDTLGCYGNKKIKTPNIDRLAEEGAVFDKCFTPFPLCCPARTSLWTGVMTHKHNVSGNWFNVAPMYADGKIISPFLKEGYNTIYTGKWHVPGTTPAKMGFENFCAIPDIVNNCDKGRYISEYREYAISKGYSLAPRNFENLTENDKKTYGVPGKAPCGTSEIALEDYLETWQTGKFLKAMDERKKDKPFFAVCSYNAPHFPMIVPKPFDTLYAPEEVDLPPNFLTGIEGKPKEVIDSEYFKNTQAMDENDWRKLIAHYWGFCSLVDEQVGRILDYLKENGLMDNTIIVYTSDHGDMMGSHGLNQKGYPMHYNEDLQVPLVVYHPGMKDKKQYDGFITLMDILPTLGEMVGIENGFENIDGISYAKLWNDKAFVEPREYAICETFKIGGKQGGAGQSVDISKFNPAVDMANVSICTKEFKYIFHLKDIDELYDLKVDPIENNNLINEPSFGVTIKKLQDLIIEDITKGNSTYANIIKEKMQEKY